MRSLILIFLFLFVFAAPHFVRACGNEYYSSIEMPLQKDSLLLHYLLTAPGDFIRPYWWNGFEENIIMKRDSLLRALSKQKGTDFTNGWALIKELKNERQTTIDYKLVSDFALHELKVGEKALAIKLLELLYASHPNEYTILANLGTAYELTGKNTKALELLQKAIAINPQSHFGSEWIHIKILEQKISSAPDYSSIINLGSKNFGAWLTDNNYSFPQEPDSLKKQIAYQLHERISFIKPPDPIVAQLVLDFADIVARHNGYEAAIPFYEYAANYGTTAISDIVVARKQVLHKTREEIKATFNWASVVWVVPLVVFVLIFIAWIRGRKNQPTPE